VHCWDWSRPSIATGRGWRGSGMSAYREATQRPYWDGWPTPADAGDGRDARAPSGTRRLFTDPAVDPYRPWLAGVWGEASPQVPLWGGGG